MVKITLKEIGKLAGVSPSTVSRVLNIGGGKFASPAVNDRIWAIATEYGYSPNMNAKQLRLGQQGATKFGKTLAIVFGRTDDINNDPFFSKIARAAQTEAYRKGYLVKYLFSALGVSQAGMEKMIAQIKVDGVVVMGRLDKDIYALLVSNYRNVIYTALNAASFPCDQVICDGYKGAAVAVEYLFKSGHIDIGYVGEQTYEVRYIGYWNTMKRLKLPIPLNNVSCTQSTEDACEAMLYFLEKHRPPSALFCVNDTVAIGVMQALKQRGYAIPRDVSLISVDDIEMASSCSPMLTTMSVPKSELGKTAVKLLVDRIENGHKINIKAELPFTLIKRESVYELSQL